jgi:hypothetical protein
VNFVVSLIYILTIFNLISLTKILKLTFSISKNFLFIVSERDILFVKNKETSEANGFLHVSLKLSVVYL